MRMIRAKILMVNTETGKMDTTANALVQMDKATYLVERPNGVFMCFGESEDGEPRGIMLKGCLDDYADDAPIPDTYIPGDKI